MCYNFYCYSVKSGALNSMNIISGIIDTLIVGFVSYIMFSSFQLTLSQTAIIVLLPVILTIGILAAKQMYSKKQYCLKDYYTLFEGIAVSYGILSILAFNFGSEPMVIIILVFNAFLIYALMVFVRLFSVLFNKFCRRTRNVLIVGAGQDGKLIAEEIKQRPELKLNVVGFLDDNMNSIEDEDSSINILGLTCDSEAVIKDNNVKLVIVAVKSRMDSDILTDLVKGIPLGVKVWRMYRFYEKITQKFLVSKMSVNWLFYDCVRKRALLYASLKRFCDVISSIAILVLTLPLSIIAAIGIKLSDLGPIFFTQTRMGKFGKPFKMIKFRIMYQDKIADDFDDDVNEITSDDQRMIPFCKILRKFHIDEIPQMINVLRGDMSIIGPRPVREEVYYENKESIPFWECRNWVRPGWCGWQQLNVNEPTPEQRVGYDLYYIKHQNLLWEISIFLRFIGKVIIGKARRGK